MSAIIEALQCSQCQAEHRFVTANIRHALVAAEAEGWHLVVHRKRLLLLCPPCAPGPGYPDAPGIADLARN